MLRLAKPWPPDAPRDHAHMPEAVWAHRQRQGGDLTPVSLIRQVDAVGIRSSGGRPYQNPCRADTL